MFFFPLLVMGQTMGKVINALDVAGFQETYIYVLYVYDVLPFSFFFVFVVFDLILIFQVRIRIRFVLLTKKNKIICNANM